MEYRPAPFFLSVGTRRLFVTHPVTDSAHDAKPILILPAFAEEMNRTRRYVTHLSNLLLQAGYSVWSVDLSCTGDSSGKFSAASVAQWQKELVATIQHICAQDNPPDLLAIRGGSLFLPALANNESLKIGKVCLVEPISTGGQLLNEFLRIRVAKSMFEGTKETVSSLATLLEDGDSLEVGGYKVSSNLYHEILELSLESQSFKLDTKGLVLGCMRALNEARQKKLVHSVAQWQCPEGTFKTSALEVEPFWANDLAKVDAALDSAIVEYFATD